MFSTTKIAALLISFFSIVHVTAQKMTIRGKATDEKGEPVIGATILIKGTRTGTSTDVSGDFTIRAPHTPVTLVCASVGFVAGEIKLKEKDFKDSVATVSIILKADTRELAEVVVTGYDTERRPDDFASAYKDYRTPSPAGIAKGRKSGLKSEAAVPATTRVKGVTVVPTTKDDYYSGETKTTYPGSEKEKILEKRTSLLTAGEVNDFKKWTMWEDYNENDFKTHSNKWSLFATQRYSVQLQNNNFKAVVGETVYLINKETNKIIWTAVSDNTGKAELWNGFSNNTKEKNVVIEIKNEKKQFPAIPFSQGINHIQLNRSCVVSNKVEIAFVVDATGSMGDEIEYLKEELGDILAKIPAKDPSVDLHTAAVFYRDKGDDYITRLQAFSKGIGSTVEFIKKQAAGGGGDYPEALKEALEDATGKLEWSADARTKIIFLLMDAPPHDEEKNAMAMIIANAAAQGIRIVPVACSGTDKATEFIMRSIALATNGTYLFLTDDSGIGGAHIKPTTDEFKVELLNDLLQRIIEQMCFVNTCEDKIKTDEPVSLYTNIEKVKIFPNPTRGPVTLETTKELKEIFVLDFTGKILLRTEVKDVKNQYKIDLSGFPSATYFIRYITKENKAGAEKIVLVH